MKIDYQSLPFELQRKLDQKAYGKYYDSCFIDDSEDEDGFINMAISPLTFNQWYGTDLHKKHIQPYIRKYKLEKIKKTVI